MKKTRWKRIGLIALIIALVTMLIVGVSMVSAIAKHTSEKSESSPHSGTSSDQKVNNELFDSQLFNATHNRSRWLYDLINASGRAKIDNESDGNAIFRTAYRLGLIDTVSEDDLFLPLDRLFIAQTTVRALGYPERTVGDLADVPPAQKSVMGTMAYYGYFVPDHEDMVYPNAAISAKEYERLKTELNRYRALKGKNVLAFGDSIMHGNGNHEEGIAVLIAAKYGMTVNDYSVPGASFGDRGERSRICNQIRVAQMADEKADLILLNGGTNDMGHTPFGENDKGFDMTDADETTFTGGMQKALWMLRMNWKGIPVVYTRVHNMDLVEDKLERQYGDWALDITDKWEIRSVDLYNGTSMNTENKAICDRYTFVDERYGEDHDSIHPNALGYAKYYLPPIAKAVAEQFNEV